MTQLKQTSIHQNIGDRSAIQAEDKLLEGTTQSTEELDVPFKPVEIDMEFTKVGIFGKLQKKKYFWYFASFW